jgi:hypothetical protein
VSWPQEEAADLLLLCFPFYCSIFGFFTLTRDAKKNKAMTAKFNQ